MPAALVPAVLLGSSLSLSSRRLARQRSTFRQRAGKRARKHASCVLILATPLIWMAGTEGRELAIVELKGQRSDWLACGSRRSSVSLDWRRMPWCLLLAFQFRLIVDLLGNSNSVWGWETPRISNFMPALTLAGACASLRSAIPAAARHRFYSWESELRVRHISLGEAEGLVVRGTQLLCWGNGKLRDLDIPALSGELVQLV